MDLTASQSWRRGVITALIAALAWAPALRAQGNEGATELLLPVGARATALGFAFAAERGGEAIWSNPAGLARITKPEFALDHFQTFIVPGGESVSLVLPAGAVGVFGVAARLFSYDTLALVDEFGNDLGVDRPRAMTLGATFAASFGDRFSAGVNFLIYRITGPCKSNCGDGFSGSATTGALDAGVQFRPSVTSPVQFGAVIRSLGRKLQLQDNPQSDALPTRLHLGASYRPTRPGWDPALRVLGTAEVVADPGLSSKELRLGAEVGYVSGPTLLHARGGYVKQTAESGNTGGVPSVGLGLTSGRVQLDLTRIFDSFQTTLGTAPTYISVRIGL